MGKAALAAVLFVAANAGAFAAWKVRSHGGRCLVLAEAFTGGALLNAALVHLLADAADELGGGYAWPELLCGLGCLLTHLLEAVAEALAEAAGHRHAHKKPDARELRPSAPSSLVGRAVSCPAVVGDGRGREGADHDSHTSTSEAEEWGLVPLDVATAPAAGGAPTAANGGAPAAEGRTAEAWRSLATGPLLMLALSMHSLLEGLSLGAASAARVLHLFLAILAHKGIAAFSLGIAWLPMASSGRSYAAAMAWFAVVTPFGVCLGVPVEGSSWGAGVTALSSGTFLYIGLVEACPGVRKPWLPGAGALQQAAAFCGGFASMATLALWT